MPQVVPNCSTKANIISWILKFELRCDFLFVYSFFIPYSTRQFQKIGDNYKLTKTIVKTLRNIHLKRAASPASFTLLTWVDQSQSSGRLQPLCLRCHAVLWLVKFVGRFHRQPVITSMLVTSCRRGLNLFPFLCYFSRLHVDCDIYGDDLQSL